MLWKRKRDDSQPSLIDAVLAAVTELREGVGPSVEVFKGSEEFLCSANTVGWHLFKQLKLDQGVDKFPSTRIVWLEHIIRAHVQWGVWSQDLIINADVPDPITLRCQMQYVKLLPLLTKETPAPGAVLQLIRCNCGSTNVESTSKCSRRCSCKRHNLVCTELCNCAGDDKCQNTEPIVNGLDIDDDND